MMFTDYTNRIRMTPASQVRASTGRKARGIEGLVQRPHQELKATPSCDGLECAMKR